MTLDADQRDAVARVLAQPDDGMRVPFSAQAHHGFVDGYHVQKLAQALARRIAAIIS